MLTSVTANGARPSIITLLSVPAIHHTNKYIAYFIFVLRFLNQRGVQRNGIWLATVRPSVDVKLDATKDPECDVIHQTRLRY